MLTRNTVFAATVAAIGTLASFGAAHADGLLPIHAASIDLGNVSGIAYYTVEANRFHVVTTLVHGDTGTPVRIVADLAPGQVVVLSAPSEADGPPVGVEIRRQADTLHVREVVAATN